MQIEEALKKIEALMERWHIGRSEDAETLDAITDILKELGLLSFFEKKIVIFVP